MRNDWETPPTVEGVIVRAWIGEDGQPDVVHVQGVDVADDIGNLNRVIGDPDNPDPNRGRLRERAKSYAKALANDILR